MKRIAVFIVLGIVGLLLLNILVATVLLMVEIFTHFGEAAQIIGLSQEAVVSYFHLTGYAMFVLIAIAFYLLWEGPDLKRFFKKKA